MSYEYIFKTHVVNGQEYYEYSTDVLAKNFDQREHPTIIKKTSRFRKVF